MYFIINSFYILNYATYIVFIYVAFAFFSEVCYFKQEGMNMNGKYKSLHNEELNRFWNEAGVSELVSLRPIDFVDKMASFLFSPEICEIYLKKRKEAAEDENMHIFVLCALIFRDHPNAEEWLYNFDFSSAEELSLTKNILRNISILDKTTEEIHRLLKNKTQHYSCQYEQEFIDLYERSFKDNKL